MLQVSNSIKLLGLIYCLSFLSYTNLQSQTSIKVYDKFDDFEKDWLGWNSDTILVINFWATWCKPCVQELPYFEALHQNKSKLPLKVILVSIDRKSDTESRLQPFLSKREMTTEVFLLADGRAHEWIDKVDPSWSGSIPATVLLKKGKKEFYEKEFDSYEDLLTTVKNF